LIKIVSCNYLWNNFTYMYNMTHIYFTLVCSWSADGNAEFFIKYKWDGNNICVVWIIDITIFCVWSYWLSIATKSFASSTISHGNVAADLLLSNIPTLTIITTLGKYNHYLFIEYSKLKDISFGVDDFIKHKFSNGLYLLELFYLELYIARRN